jgi:hypothetical protein
VLLQSAVLQDERRGDGVEKKRKPGYITDIRTVIENKQPSVSKL